MRWTKQLNTALLKAYYRATKLETDRTAYRTKLAEQWRVEQPTIPMEAQRLSDQVRSILRRQVFSQAEIETIKATILQEKAKEQETQVEQPQKTQNGRETQRSSFVPQKRQSILPEGEDAHIEEIFQEKHLGYLGVDIKKRPRLSKVPNDRKSKEVCLKVNNIVKPKLEESVSLEETCHIIYCSAATVCQILKVKPMSETSTTPDIAPWEKRLLKRIDIIRKTVGILYTFLKSSSPPSKKLKRKIRMLAKSEKIKTSDPRYVQHLEKLLEKSKQNLKATANRLKRYRTRTKRYKENLLFVKNQKCFYRQLEQTEEIENDTIRPSKEEMFAFWSNIWSNSVAHEEDAFWIRKETDKWSNIDPMGPIQISTEDVSRGIKTLKNWSAPGLDGIHNFWWKQLTSSHKILAQQLNTALINPDSVPGYFTEGTTVMLPKKDDLKNPKNYRPITCLPTVYKIFTSILTVKIGKHITENRILAWEQNGCRRKARGCKENLVIDTIITRQAKLRNRNISLAWIDYRKAFDSIPHSWLLHVLRMYKINEQIIELLEHLMSNWSTTLKVKSKTQEYQTGRLAIKRGIFQGDSLSPLWFCLALNPLSTMLNASSHGYSINANTWISHLFYMDDLKLYAKGANQLTSLLETVVAFSKTVHMELGTDKCAILHVTRGDIQHTDNLTLMDGTTIDGIGLEENYKYLGIEQAFNINKTSNKERVIEEFHRRLNLVVKSHLKAKNCFNAINSWVVPSLAFTFGILPWSPTELQNLDRKVRTTLTKFRMHHPKSAIERLYLPRTEGGRALVNLELAHLQQKEKLVKYFQNKHLPVIESLVQIDYNFSPLNLSQQLTECYKNKLRQLKQNWQQKALHGRFSSSLEQQDISKTQSVTYLKQGYLFPETEGALSAIQDQVVPTRTYKKYILKEDVPIITCRLGCPAQESIQHIISGCTSLAPTAYLNRHNNMGKVLHQSVCLKYKLLNDFIAEYKYVPAAVRENETCKVLWDMDIITDRTVQHNRPDMLILEKASKTVYIVDFAVPLDDNARKMYSDKLAKYEDLAREIKNVWEVTRVEIMPIIITANGLVHKQVTTHLHKLGITINIISAMQRAVILGTTSIVRKFISP